MRCSACGGAKVMPKGAFRYGRCNRCKGTGLEPVSDDAKREKEEWSVSDLVRNPIGNDRPSHSEKDDLVQRLRGSATDAEANPKGYACYDGAGLGSFFREAADHIETLEACIEGARAILDRNELLSVDWPATDWEDVMVMLADPYRTKEIGSPDLKGISRDSQNPITDAGERDD